jgi:hypothetical protein
MILHYMSETGSLESATLAAYIKTDFPRNIARDIFSQFEKEWWKNISKAAINLIMIDMVQNV